MLSPRLRPLQSLIPRSTEGGSTGGHTFRPASEGGRPGKRLPVAWRQVHPLGLIRCLMPWRLLQKRKRCHHSQRRRLRSKRVPLLLRPVCQVPLSIHGVAPLWVAVPIAWPHASGVHRAHFPFSIVRAAV